MNAQTQIRHTVEFLARCARNYTKWNAPYAEFHPEADLAVYIYNHVCDDIGLAPLYAPGY